MVDGNRLVDQLGVRGVGGWTGEEGRDKERQSISESHRQPHVTRHHPQHLVERLKVY